MHPKRRWSGLVLQNVWLIACWFRLQSQVTQSNMLTVFGALECFLIRWLVQTSTPTNLLAIATTIWGRSQPYAPHWIETRSMLSFGLWPYRDWSTATAYLAESQNISITDWKPSFVQRQDRPGIIRYVMREDLHWLEFPNHVTFILVTIAFRCLQFNSRMWHLTVAWPELTSAAPVDGPAATRQRSWVAHMVGVMRQHLMSVWLGPSADSGCFCPPLWWLVGCHPIG